MAGSRVGSGSAFPRSGSAEQDPDPDQNDVDPQQLKFSAFVCI